MDFTPGPWVWHDTFGRKMGEGKPIHRNALNEGPPLGQCSPFSFAVSDSHGFVVAHCTNALVTMSSERSTANAKLISAAPDLLAALQGMVDMFERNINGQEGPDDAAARWDAAREAIDRATKD